MRPSNDGGPGTCYPGKKFWILILYSAIPRAFELFGRDSGQVSRLRFGKFTSILKSYQFFKSLTVLPKTEETGLDLRLRSVFRTRGKIGR